MPALSVCELESSDLQDMFITIRFSVGKQGGCHRRVIASLQSIIFNNAYNMI